MDGRLPIMTCCGILDGMKKIPDEFATTSLCALHEEEKPLLLRALEEPSVRGLRLRDAAALPCVTRVLPDIGGPVPWAREAHYISGDSAAGSHILHAAGVYYLQEPSAMAAVAALDVGPGQRVLDLCAAPGGKSTQIGAALGGDGLLVANEYVPHRAKVLSHNIERLGIRNAVVTNEAPDRLARRWGAWFDRILVDAPCSGEGMFRREQDSRAEWTAQSPTGCAARQRQILDSAAEMLLPGGVLVYSTCTFNTVENEGVVADFLAGHPDFAPDAFALAGVGEAVEGCLRLWPHRVRGEGHFVARLRRAGEARHDEGGRIVALGPVFPAYEGLSMAGALYEAGSRVWVMPVGTPGLDGIRVLRSGLALGERRGKIFVPDHAAVMAFAPDAFAQAVALEDEDASRYLRGETLHAEHCANGWTVVGYHGYSLGWTKCVDGILKNHLPRGLRRMS